MLGIKNILHATDFSPCATQALQNAVFLAKKYRARLHLLHAVVLHGDFDPINPALHVSDMEKYLASVTEAVQDRITRVLQTHAVENVDVIEVQERGIAPAPVILDYARDQAIDLIVMGTHGRRGLGHMVLGSVAEEVVRSSPCPVLTIQEQDPPVEVETKKQILVPLDFSKNSPIAIAHAKHIAATYRAEIQLLHVFEQSIHPAFYSSGANTIFEFMPHLEPECTRNLKRLYDETEGPEIPVNIYVAEGRAAPEIVRFAARHHSDMIVMNTHGLTGIVSLLLGSVAQKVVQSTKCPVLTVRASGVSLLDA